MMREDILVAARACIGTRFRHQGRLVGHGLDCVGLLICVARQCGMTVCDSPNYDRRPAHGLLEKHLNLSGLSPISLDDMQTGDVALFQFNGPPQHVAILGDARRPFSMIHSYMPARHVVEHRLDDLWRRRLVGAYRFPGV